MDGKVPEDSVKVEGTILDELITSMGKKK